MKYKNMIEEARSKGQMDETAMWESIDCVSDLLESVKKVHPELVEKFLRKQHKLLYHGHYDEAFAQADVSKLRFTDSNGMEHEGAHWTVDQILGATSGVDFPDSVTKWDKYVAFNAAYADFCKNFTETQILQIGYDFYFADEDWDGETKVWDYMSLTNK